MIKSMTVEADGTGGMDFTFDSPEDLARLWSLNGSSDIEIQVMKPALYDGPLPVAGKPYTGPVHSDVLKPPIPLDVYYSDGHFFSQTTRQTMGGTFYSMWIERAHEFPTAHR